MRDSRGGYDQSLAQAAFIDRVPVPIDRDLSEGFLGDRRLFGGEDVCGKVTAAAAAAAILSAVQNDGVAGYVDCLNAHCLCGDMVLYFRPLEVCAVISCHHHCSIFSDRHQLRGGLGAGAAAAGTAAWLGWDWGR